MLAALDNVIAIIYIKLPQPGQRKGADRKGLKRTLHFQEFIFPCSASIYEPLGDHHQVPVIGRTKVNVSASTYMQRTSGIVEILQNT